MSFVWNVILSFDNEEFWEDDEDEPREKCEPLERINAWIPNGRLVNLTAPTFRKGVGHGMDANLYGGGFRHFDIEAFIDLVKAQEWKERSKVQLWVKGATEGMGMEPFTLVDLKRNAAAKTRKRRATAKKGALTKKRRRTALKGVATRKANKERLGTQEATA